MANITITLLSGISENETADFCLRFSEAALKKGHGINLFLYGNAANLANKEIPWTGDRGMSQDLTDFMDSGRLVERVKNLGQKGATIHTCHTIEYVRGTEGSEYLEEVQRGNVGTSLTKFLLTSDIAFTLGS